MRGRNLKKLGRPTSNKLHDSFEKTGCTRNKMQTPCRKTTPVRSAPGSEIDMGNSLPTMDPAAMVKRDFFLTKNVLSLIRKTQEKGVTEKRMNGFTSKIFIIMALNATL